MIEFRLPDVGEGLEEAEVMRWLVAPGDRVERDQPIVEIQTDKALVEIPAPAAGTVARLSAAVGAIVKVGQLLFVIDTAGGGDTTGEGIESSTGAADAAREKEAAKAAEGGGADAERSGVDAAKGGGADAAKGGGATAKGGLLGGDAAAADVLSAKAPTGPHRIRPRAAPAVRKLATELGIDLTAIPGSGPEGRVLADDVRRAADERAASALSAAAAPADELAARRAATAAARGGSTVPGAPPSTALPSSSIPRELGQAAPGRIPIAGVRRVIAQTMTKAWTTIPHIHGHDELDALPLIDALRGLRRRAAARVASDVLTSAESTTPAVRDRGSMLTLSVMFVLAAARALRRFPLVNSSIDTDANEILVHEEVNIGLAVATPAGLIVPVIRGADRRSLSDLAAEIDRLARGARERKVKPEELRSGTFTVTNFGSLGGRFANPIIRPPEVGILGFGAVRERPWAVGGGRVETRPVLPISFGADHRLIDGDLSVAFQEHVRDLLSDPVHLLLGE